VDEPIVAELVEAVARSQGKQNDSHIIRRIDRRDAEQRLAGFDRRSDEAVDSRLRNIPGEGKVSRDDQC
jgi:hypothetical protein